MKLRARETFYVVFDPNDLGQTAILTKELEDEWHKVDPQKDGAGYFCRDAVYQLDDDCCVGCGAPI